MNVRLRRQATVLPTFEPARPDPNPMFLEKRVYQGSSGKVYPLPFTDRIAEAPTPRAWDAVYLENEHLEVMILPELGGRIHAIRDKANGYDLLYRQEVIKPALVGLAGPWVSGGIEFNWPQHHRPSTYLPAEVAIERHDAGAVTVWLSEHDPMARMKGMHGVCLRPGAAVVEIRARIHNRTDWVQTFLWWANIAVKVHADYQSFFPPDVRYVADHAKRATATFPRCDDRYYGVDYGARGRAQETALRAAGRDPAGERRADDLSWYANIPVPTSYMAMGSREDFFGGYDHAADAGLVHVADHHIAPGKKQWTWGNHPFGYAWDRNLTEPDAQGHHAPYIELMAGVYTDNQPDFSFLLPGETRTWSQFLYPLRGIGPAIAANAEAALSLRAEGTSGKKPRLRLGLVSTRDRQGARLQLRHRDQVLADLAIDLKAGQPWTHSLALAAKPALADCRLQLVDAGGQVLLEYQPQSEKPSPDAATRAQDTATEPPAPEAVVGADELILIAQHLEQYRHATRHPEAYWREALRRDPGDSRAHLGLGRWHLRRGELDAAEEHLRAAIRRLTSRNPNPADGEAHYHLALVLRTQAQRARALDPRAATDTRLDGAVDAAAKATWNHAWQAPAHYLLAEIAALRERWDAVLDRSQRCLRRDADHLRARWLKILAHRALGQTREAARELDELRALDPLDLHGRHLAGEPLPGDAQLRLDLAHDHARIGQVTTALEILHDVDPAASPAALGSGPTLAHTRAWLHALAGDAPAAERQRQIAATLPPDHCFPARLEELFILEATRKANPRDGRAALYLGHWLYDRRRHAEAIAQWRAATQAEPGLAMAWRCLGIGALNILNRPTEARRAFEQAWKANPGDARLLYERDQLWKRLGIAPQRRRRELQRHADLVARRDDLTLELCALHNQLGEPAQALALLGARRFQPWEGGEGQTLGQHTRARVGLARQALREGQPQAAISHLQAALEPPENLGEARHLLANASDLHHLLGQARRAAGDQAGARTAFEAAAGARGDFQAMSQTTHSEMTVHSARALESLGRKVQAKALLRELLAYGKALERQPAKIDYFATSLPTLLLFEDDLQARQVQQARLLQAQAHAALGKASTARRLLQGILQEDPAHALAADLLAELTLA